MITNKKVGLALSSGGARGFAHVGFINILQKNGIDIDYVAGTSMGALVSAYYALYGEVQSLYDVADGFRRRRDLLPLIDINDPRISLIKGEKMREFLYKFFGEKTFDDTRIPLAIGATALDDGSRVVFRKGKILDALMMSGAFPGVFPPVMYKGRWLVDGGLADATPVDVVSKMGADVILGVDLFSLDKVKKDKYDSIQLLERVYSIIMSRLSYYREKEYGKHILVLKPNVGRRIDTFAFNNSRKFIKAGEALAAQNMAKIKKMLE